jgi:hypothetical protein
MTNKQEISSVRLYDLEEEVRKIWPSFKKWRSYRGDTQWSLETTFGDEWFPIFLAPKKVEKYVRAYLKTHEFDNIKEKMTDVSPEENQIIRIPDSKITLSLAPGKWIIEISEDGFKFNREDYPQATANDFARAFVEILEKQFVVTMEKRQLWKNEEWNHKSLESPKLMTAKVF